MSTTEPAPNPYPGSPAITPATGVTVTSGAGGDAQMSLVLEVATALAADAQVATITFGGEPPAVPIIAVSYPLQATAVTTTGFTLTTTVALSTGLLLVTWQTVSV